MAVSVLQGTKAPIKKLRIGEDSNWSDVTSRTRGTTGPASVPVFKDKESSLRVRFGTAHVTFTLRFDDFDEEECELVLLGLLGASTEEERLVKGGWAVISLKPQSGGDKRAGLDIARDGRLKPRRGRDPWLPPSAASHQASAEPWLQRYTCFFKAVEQCTGGADAGAPVADQRIERHRRCAAMRCARCAARLL